AEVPLDTVLAHVAVAAEDLQARVGGPVRGLARVELRLRGRPGERGAGVLEPGGAQDEHPRSLELRLHVREREPDGLERRERRAELRALLRVRGRESERAAGDPDRLRADADPA